MREIELTSDDLVSALLRISESEIVCILDSCGVRHLGSHLLLAGVRPVESFELTGKTAKETLDTFDARSRTGLAGIFTLGYDLGLKLNGLEPSQELLLEPDLFLSLFDVLLLHDYATATTYLIGDKTRFALIEDLIRASLTRPQLATPEPALTARADSNFTRSHYIAAVERIREYIRSGDTYQANLTQQITCRLPDGTTPQEIFLRLRRDHPAPFAAFLKRLDSTVVSASPERFFSLKRSGRIETSPIKGTVRRGRTTAEDARLRYELESSEKDRAENIMIVDLLRNDLGRVCEFGSVTVEKLCDVEEHPSLFHLVSTIRGQVRGEAELSDILRAAFPCGSITGAPKLRTMEIIKEIEPVSRGLSMGAIGCFLPETWPTIDDTRADVSVAIRTMVVRDGDAIFNVGGGIVIDSDPVREYEESLLKAKALLNGIGAVFDPD